MFGAITANVLQSLHTDYEFSFSMHPHTGMKDQKKIDQILSRSQRLSMKDIPQGSGPTTADMVEPY
jgi:hypothetical protein